MQDRRWTSANASEVSRSSGHCCVLLPVTQVSVREEKAGQGRFRNDYTVRVFMPLLKFLWTFQVANLGRIQPGMKTLFFPLWIDVFISDSY